MDIQPYDDFSTADDIRLAKLNQGIAGVENDASEGNLYPEEAQGIRSMIDEARGPLLQRKQAAEEQKKQKAVQDLYEQNALKTSLTQADAQHDAQNFHQRTVTDVDPVTGQATRYYQESPGTWKPAPEKTPVDEGIAGASGGVEYMPVGGGLDVGAAGASNEAPDPAKVGPEGHTMTIYNGANRSEVHFGADGRLTGQENYGPDGQPIRPTPQTQEANQLGIPAPTLQRLQREAFGLFPGNDRSSAAGRQHYINNGADKERQRLLQEHHLRIKAAAETANEHGERWQKGYDDALKGLTKSWNDQHPGEYLPSDVHQQFMDRAKAIADDRHASAGFPLPKGRKGGSVPAEAQAPAGEPSTHALQMRKGVTNHDLQKKREELGTKLDGEDVPEEFQSPAVPGTAFSPKGKATAKWADMPPEAKSHEVEQRLRKWLAPTAGAQPTAAGAQPATGGEQPAQQVNPNVVNVIKERQKALGLGPTANAAPPAPAHPEAAPLSPEEQKRAREAYDREARGRSGDPTEPARIEWPKAPPTYKPLPHVPLTAKEQAAVDEAVRKSQDEAKKR